MNVKTPKLPLLPGEILARRSAGHIVHVMQARQSNDPRSAICGTTPTRSSHASYTRTDWWYATGEVTCAKCNRILADRMLQEYRDKHPDIAKIWAEQGVGSE